MPYIVESSQPKAKNIHHQAEIEEISHEDLAISHKISTSKFDVYIAQDTSMDTEFAIKLFPHTRDESKPMICPQFLNEKRFSNLCHSNVIRMISSKSNRKLQIKNQKITNTSYIIYELATYGSLFEIALVDEFQRSERIARTMLQQLLSGIDYLHKNGVAHMDIKPENILLGGDFQLKICDFDGAFQQGDAETIGRGTPNYRAPEIIYLRKVQDPYKTDIYSAGIVLFTLLFGHLPCVETEECVGKDMFKLMHSKDTSQFWALHQDLHPELQISQDFKDLFEKMVCFNPEKRATIQEIKESKWFKGEKMGHVELKRALLTTAKPLNWVINLYIVKSFYFFLALFF